MKPLFSDEERRQTVRNLIVARYHNQAQISSFDRLVHYLNENRVEVLCGLEKSGEKPVFDKHDYLIRHDPIYDETDAETYFEWLVAVVTGAEKTQENIVEQANDQLFQFIHVLGDDIEIDKGVQLLAPYDWQKLFFSFDERLTEMQRIIDRGDKEITEVLKSILQMVRKNVAFLDILCKESEELFGKSV